MATIFEHLTNFCDSFCKMVCQQLGRTENVFPVNRKAAVTWSKRAKYTEWNDLTKPEFWQTSLKKITDQIDQFIAEAIK